MNISNSRMKDGTKSWNPFMGCNFSCKYCIASFHAKGKRQMFKCTDCYNFSPHQHPERLSRIPNADKVFVCGKSDISFCSPEFVRQIIAAIVERNKKYPFAEYYFHTKRPEYLAQFLSEFPKNVVLATTLETNRDKGYGDISKAPKPSIRYEQFKQLNWPYKAVAIEPIMDFDLEDFAEWLISLNPMCLWLGSNSHPRSVQLPEPSRAKVEDLLHFLETYDITLRGKGLQDIDLEKIEDFQMATMGDFQESLDLVENLKSALDWHIKNKSEIPPMSLYGTKMNAHRIISDLIGSADAACDLLYAAIKAMATDGGPA